MFVALERFLSGLSGGQRLLAIILVLAVTSALVAFLAGGWATGIPVGLLVLAVLWITGPLWKPAEHTSGRLRVALSSLALFSSVAMAVLGRTPEGHPFVNGILKAVGLKPESTESLAVIRLRLVQHA